MVQPAFFHVNRKEIVQFHQGQRSVRKPDVVLVSATDFSLESATDAQRLNAADKPPTDNFGWCNVRAAVEFKYKHRVKGPPIAYTVERSTPGVGDVHPSQNCIDDVEERAFLATSYLLVSGSQSRSHRSKEPDSAVSQNTEVKLGKKRKVNTSERELRSQEVFGASSDQGPGSRSKRLKVENNQAGSNQADPAIQVGTYGTEMFASHAARQHVICFLIMGSDLTIWRYDRQGAIKSSKLNFIQDLSRFLVFLLAIQRFQNCHWGLHPKVDPEFGELTKPSSNSPVSTMHIDDAEKGLVDITLDHFSDRRVPHYGLNGRATDVYPATSKVLGLTEELVAKLYWGEESRMSEADILQKVYVIAETEPDVKNHVPDMLFSHKFPNSSTAAVRERLNLSTKGSRVHYCIVFRRLERITTLYGDQFLTCWWHTVKCHLALWKRGVYHRDISASNLM
ncbi:hypothetical protein L210DRAFT_738630 [Boletus edulis BED1]|uniref:Fungal-type protein kinase domain-containing protein n=1 Tax=Boletus edulis BED1 TaxID=1328754 RepID=A0AAD4GJI9_BOLED|nr:hypothetical protein L210DRAFT_738630 [Boletus edulis BED1]